MKRITIILLFASCFLGVIYFSGCNRNPLLYNTQKTMDIDFEIVGVYLPVENIDGPTWLAIGMWRSMEFFLFSGHFAAVLFSTMVIESGSQIMILILKALY